jgi:hypothetical protein
VSFLALLRDAQEASRTLGFQVVVARTGELAWTGVIATPSTIRRNRPPWVAAYSIVSTKG